MEKPTLGEDRTYGSVADKYASVELLLEIQQNKSPSLGTYHPG